MGAARFLAVFPQAAPAARLACHAPARYQAVTGGAPDNVVLDTIKNVRDPG